MRGRRVSFLLAAIATLFVAPETPLAHPISQGAMIVRIFPGNIRVEARVPVEEVFVASALGEGPAAGRDGGRAPWTEHGEYLLRHFRIEAGGHPLAGSVRGVVEPDATHPGFAFYELEYLLAQPPSALSLTQDLLREIEYAPGNPWEATYIARFERSGAPPREGLLLTSGRALVIECDAPASGSAGAGTEAAASAAGDRSRTFRQYLRLGIEHILGGYDHLLFVGALVLTAVTLGDLVKVVTAFTIAHSVTLTLSVLDIVRLPSRIVEPTIAASIVIVALSNLLRPERARGWTRIGMAFFFGLFHGLGFAGGLLDAMQGMPGGAVGLSIAAFSAGVELGHQMIVLPLFAVLTLARAPRLTAARREGLSLALVRGGSLAISIAGVIYLFAALKSQGAMAGSG